VLKNPFDIIQCDIDFGPPAVRECVREIESVYLKQQPNQCFHMDDLFESLKEVIHDFRYEHMFVLHVASDHTSCWKKRVKT
jgi:hypothetical protein